MAPLALLMILFALQCSCDDLLLGVGISDITGPSAEVNFMGYAQLSQVGHGLHIRLRSRAYLFVEATSGKRVVFVNVDLCFVDVQIKKKVIDVLQEKFPGLYTHSNVLITATHTHSGPAGFSWYTIYDLTSLGSKVDNSNAIINGIVQSIVLASTNLQKGNVYINQDELIDPMSNINRSPSAYDNNPPDEISKYKFNVDKLMVNVKMESSTGTPLGTINFFPVHGTSMNNTNLLISGDNKGYASLLFEQFINGPDSVPGAGPFVAAFTNGNEGDVSPNTLGAFCDGTNTRCDYYSSTCGGKSQSCKARGPGKDMFESTQIIGNQQFQMALNLFSNATSQLSGSVNYVHTFVNMEQVLLEPQWTGLPNNITTCIGALGDSFAAGTTDGPGDFNFKQGTNSSKDNPFWNFIARFLADPPADQVQCQKPKPILLYSGGISQPSRWTPNILPIQILNIGELFILGVPAEFTTMAGRRLKDTVRQSLIKNGASPNITIVIAGLANGYSQYVTTREEFEIQRYEGASTLFGPYTLNAYQKLFSELAVSLIQNKPVPPGPTPQDFSNSVPDFLPGVLFDDGPIGKIKKDVNPAYQQGENVLAVFYSADPRNRFWQVPTYLTVEQQLPNSQWKVIATDGNWETKFYWERIFSIELGESSAAVSWDIPADTPPGTYRLGHFGIKKSIFGDFTPFSVYSSPFKVVSK